MKQRVYYKVYHGPSSTYHDSYKDFSTTNVDVAWLWMLGYLNNWNSQNPGVWTFFADDRKVEAIS